MKASAVLLLAVLAGFALALASGAHAGNYTITASYAVSGGGSPSAPALTYYNGSDVLTTRTLSSTPAAYPAYPGSQWSVSPNPLTGSGLHSRWETSSPTSGTLSQSVVLELVYFEQDQGNFSESFSGGTRTPTNGIALSYVSFGGAQTVELNPSYQSLWLDSGTQWSVPTPAWSNFVSYVAAVPGGTVTAPFQQNVAFTAGGGGPGSGTCAGPNPLAMFEGDPFGCLLPAMVDTLDSPIGIQAFAGLVIMGPVVAVYNKSQSIWMALLIVWFGGSAFGWLIPSYAATIGQVFLYLGIAGLGLKLIFRFWP